MAFLTSSQRAAIVAAIDTDETTADLYRNPSIAGGKVGAAVLTTSAIPIRVRPSSEDPRMMRLIPLAQPMNSTRVSSVGKVAVDVDVRHGDELRIGSTRYRVEGVGPRTNAVLVALSEIKGAS